MTPADQTSDSCTAGRATELGTDAAGRGGAGATDRRVWKVQKDEMGPPQVSVCCIEGRVCGRGRVADEPRESKAAADRETIERKQRVLIEGGSAGWEKPCGADGWGGRGLSPRHCTGPRPSWPGGSQGHSSRWCPQSCGAQSAACSAGNTYKQIPSGDSTCKCPLRTG